MVLMAMKNNAKKVPVVLFVGLVLVNLSNGFAIKQPGPYTASFSGSSSSASAFSHASSSSYSFGSGGAINPENLAVGAVAKASAVAGAGIHNGQAVAGAVAHAGSVAGSAAGSTAGSYDHSGANVAQSGQDYSGAVSSSGAFSGAASGSEITSGSSKPSIDNGSYKVIESPKYSTGYSSGNSENSKTNYAVSGDYAQHQQTAGGCQTCKQTSPVIVPLPLTPISNHHASSSSGSKSSYQHISPSLIATFPGPSGSILDSKPATPYHANANSGSYNNVPIPKHPQHGGIHEIIAVLPGPSGSIYDSKPANGQGAGSSYISHSGSAANNAGSSSTSYNVPVVVPSSSGNNHVFPGPSGSIHDSKPAIAGSTSTSYNIPALHPVVGPACSYTPGSPNKCGSNIPVSHPVVEPTSSGPSHVSPGTSGSIHDSKPFGAVSGSSANAGSTSTSYNIPASHPVAGPVCSYTPGSPNKCGSTAPSYNVPESNPDVAPAHSGPSHVFPGPSGSIHDSKPAGGSSASANAGAIAGSTSTSYNIPASHPVVGPVCSYTPGSPNKCPSTVPSYNLPDVAPASSGPSHVFPGPSGSIHDSKPAGAVSGSSANAGAIAGSTSTSYNIPASHPVVGPACSYTPGSPNKCGSTVPSSNPDVAPAPSGPSHVFPGPSGSIHDSKPAGGSSSANAGAIAGSTSTSYNIPTSHPVVGPVCSYTPGSPNKCGSSGTDAATSTVYNVHGSTNNVGSDSSSSGSGSITYNPYSAQPHPASNSGTYYIDKPSSNIEPPLSSSAPSFSGQIPCKDNNCGIVYDDKKDHSGQYQQINHDQAHLSGGIVYQNEDGSYSNNPTTPKTIYKNAEHGGHAVSNSEDQGGILIGPGTGNLPIEQSNKVPFGSAPGGSETFVKNAAGGSHAQSGSETVDKHVPFGYAAGGSHAKSGSETSANGFASGGSHVQSGSGSHEESDKTSVIIQKSDEVAIQKPSEYNGCSGSSCGNNFESGYATGQVLVNQGNNVYDATNSGSNEIGHSGQKLAFGVSSSGGLLNTLFGHGGLSGSSSGVGYYKSGAGYGGGSGAYSNSGANGVGYQKSGSGSAAYSSSGSYASAGSFAGASAHAGSYARSY